MPTKNVLLVLLIVPLMICGDIDDGRTPQHDIDDAITAIVLSNFLQMAGHLVNIGADPDNPDHVRPQINAIFDRLNDVVNAAIRSAKRSPECKHPDKITHALVESFDTQQFTKKLRLALHE